MSCDPTYTGRPLSLPCHSPGQATDKVLRLLEDDWDPKATPGMHSQVCLQTPQPGCSFTVVRAACGREHLGRGDKHQNQLKSSRQKVT
jgi:hypothetical protein